MAVLHLTLKKKWFDMIATGVKKEEYRDTKPYWYERLMYYDLVSRNNIKPIKRYTEMKQFDEIHFRNGYGKNAPFIIVECLGIEIGDPNPEWSDGFSGNCFVLKLGNIIIGSAKIKS